MAPFLIPFLKMSCVYFVLDLPTNDPSLAAAAAFVKALPVLSLAWLVCLQGIGIGEPPNHYITYNRWILCGLLFSSAGDILLTWQIEEIYFILGMIAFACTMVCYITAFGFSPFGLKEFIFCFICVLLVLATLIPCMSPGLFLYLVPLYAVLLAIMCWRSLARFSLQRDIPWRKIFSAVGALLFVISDFVLGINKFCFSVPFHHHAIMCTYYAAQLCISLSVINSHLYRDQYQKHPPPTSSSSTGRLTSTLPSSPGSRGEEKGELERASTAALRPRK